MDNNKDSRKLQTNKPRKPVTTRESNFLRAKQNRENQDDIIIKAAKINNQTERPEPGMGKSPMVERIYEPSDEDATNAPSIESFSAAELGNQG